MKDSWEVGDRVRDKFKQPKPGAEAVCGKIEKLNPTYVHVRMDDGNVRTIPRGTFNALFIPDED